MIPLRFFVLFGAIMSVVHAQTVYISPLGDDVQGAGSESHPYHTLNFALDHVIDGAQIIVFPGAYTGPNLCNINKKVSIVAHPTCSSPRKCFFDGQLQGHSVGMVLGKGATFNGIGFANYLKAPGYPSGILDTPTNMAVSISIHNCEFWNCEIAISNRISNILITNTIFTNCFSGLCFLDGFSGDASYEGNDLTFIGGREAVNLARDSSSGLVRVLVTGFKSFNQTHALRSYLTKGQFDVEISNFEVTNSQQSILIAGSSSIATSYGRLRLQNGRISNSADYQDGGAVFLGPGTNLEAHEVVFSNNTAMFQPGVRETGHGGAIFCSAHSSANIFSSTFEHNSAQDGGVAWCDPACAFSAVDVTLIANSETKNTGPCHGV